ncbi:MAG: effector binding domain-containing protein [Draconibacterium sp.]|nr:effector binding domain-containing protein [Draconibacterium sp.]
MGKTVSILQKYQEDIKMEIHNLNTIKHIITMLIVTHRNFKDLSALLSASEKINAETNDVSQGFDNTFLSERNIKMKSKDVKQNVRIVNLPNMTFACYRAESETPENDCSNIIDNFAKEKKLHKISGFRHFGFNNPNPTEGNPVYGYEMWVSIPKDFEVPSPLWKHEFSGGLFASLPATLENIFERWMELGEFMENSEKYDIDYDESKDRICLEENTNCISVYENSLPETEMHFDLLVPIKRR